MIPRRIEMKTALFSLVGSCIFAISTGTLATELAILSDSIKGNKIDKVHACGRQGGSDSSVQLSVKNIPTDAKYLAIVADDPDAVRPAGKVWVHWNVFNIPVVASSFDIGVGEKVQGDVGRTSGNSKGYEGMCPPDGVHTYRFAVFALRDKVEVGGFFGPAPMTVDFFESKFKGQIISKGMISGQF
jgi:Raf kinase inhibitor-like YbhB/YbcL family protein